MAPPTQSNHSGTPKFNPAAGAKVQNFAKGLLSGNAEKHVAAATAESILAEADHTRAQAEEVRAQTIRLNETHRVNHREAVTDLAHKRHGQAREERLLDYTFDDEAAAKVAEHQANAAASRSKKRKADSENRPRAATPPATTAAPQEETDTKAEEPIEAPAPEAKPDAPISETTGVSIHDAPAKDAPRKPKGREKTNVHAPAGTLCRHCGEDHATDHPKLAGQPLKDDS